MENQYKLRLEKIEEVLRFWLPDTVEPSSLWMEKVFGMPPEGISPPLVKSLIAPALDLVNRGGKRWRPLLMYLVAEAVAGEKGAAAALPLVPAVEFAHNASLIHDDIEDNSDERRGKPAVHLLYGNDTAINSGSFLYFLALSCINGSDYPAETKNRILRTWAVYMRRLHLGQAMDIAWHNDHSSLPPVSEYIRMCCLKTGCLARMAAVLGVQCAEGCLDSGLPADLAETLGEGAEKLGVGFQILDDVKNLSTGVPGKKRGDDIVEGKKSLPVLLYLHRYPEQIEFTASCFKAARQKGITAPEIEEFISALETAGILEEAEKKGVEFMLASRKSLTGQCFFAENSQKILDGFVEFLEKST